MDEKKNVSFSVFLFLNELEVKGFIDFVNFFKNSN